MAQSDLDHRDISGGTPALCEKSLPADVIVEEVQRLIDDLFLLNDVLPARKVFSNSNEFHTTTVASVIQNNLKILKSASDLPERIPTLIRT